jgi:hypothetical protein
VYIPAIRANPATNSTRPTNETKKLPGLRPIDSKKEAFLILSCFNLEKPNSTKYKPTTNLIKKGANIPQAKTDGKGLSI